MFTGYSIDLLFVARIASSSKSHNTKIKAVIKTDEFYIMIGLADHITTRYSIVDDYHGIEGLTTWQ